jgi:hypothetical protein
VAVAEISARWVFGHELPMDYRKPHPEKLRHKGNHRQTFRIPPQAGVLVALGLEGYACSNMFEPPLMLGGLKGGQRVSLPKRFPLAVFKVFGILFSPLIWFH